MGFNRRKMEADRKARGEAEVATRRATDAQVLEDAERLIGPGMIGKPGECPCCSHRRLARRLWPVIGFCGCIAPHAEPHRRLICGRRIVTPTPQ